MKNKIIKKIKDKIINMFRVEGNVYVIYNPLDERVVCVHSGEDQECEFCIEARKQLEKTPYHLCGEWFSIDSKETLCYCGSPGNVADFNLCEEHSQDA